MDGFLVENPIKMDDLGVPPFKETPICHSFKPIFPELFTQNLSPQIRSVTSLGLAWLESQV